LRTCPTWWFGLRVNPRVRVRVRVRVRIQVSVSVSVSVSSYNMFLFPQLFLEVVRLAAAKQPRVLLLENEIDIDIGI